MNKNARISRKARHPKVYVSSFGTNHIHYRNPWVSVWLSALFPGFGQLYLGRNVPGFILIIWEIIININAKLNDGIIYSFTGQFEKAKIVLDNRWLLLYAAVYIFSLWDSYSTTVELNKLTILAERENIRYKPFDIKLLEIYYLDKKNPWVAIVWSALMPGLGHLYMHKLFTGFFIFIWFIMISYFSHFTEAFYLTAIGDFQQVKNVVDANWLLFIPSIHTFAIYDSYTQTVENNKLFELEQANFLKDNYQDKEFEMPI